MATVATMRSHEGDFAQHRIELEPGRRLLCAEYGTRCDHPVVYLHGFMGSRLEPLVAGPVAGNVIAFDRPGYGGSTAMRRPSLRHFADDLVGALDALGVTSCGIAGASAGGAYAAAAALALGSRLSHLTLVCAVADFRTVRLGGGSVRLLARARRNLPVLRLILPRFLRQVRRTGLDRRFIRYALRREIKLIREPEVQAQLITRLTASLREGTRPGTAGIVTDIQLLGRDWDLDLASIRAPTLVLGGAADTVVPAAHARWWCQNLPHAEQMTMPRDGHVSVAVNNAARIVRGFPERTAPNAPADGEESHA